MGIDVRGHNDYLVQPALWRGITGTTEARNEGGTRRRANQWLQRGPWQPTKLQAVTTGQGKKRLNFYIVI